MGCSFSRSQAGDLSGHEFRVYNVDDDGQQRKAGKMRVGESDLILYQKGKEPIKWPLRSLRRYGFNDELFSFESGRRCPTGPGIYAFKCRNAGMLFNMVHECIQRAGQEDQHRASQNIISSSAASAVTGITVAMPPASANRSSRPVSLMDPTLESYDHVVNGMRESLCNGGTDSPHLYMNNPLLPASSTNASSLPQYVNTSAVPPSPTSTTPPDPAQALLQFLHQPPQQPPQHPSEVAAIGEALPEGMVTNGMWDYGPANGASVDPSVQDSDYNSNLTLPYGASGLALPADDGEVFQDSPTDQANTMYVNVGSEGMAGLLEESSHRYSMQHYANLGSGTVVGAASEGTATGSRSRGSETVKMHYIQLDLTAQNSENGATCSSVSPTTSNTFTFPPESPSKKTDSYACIDFKKTEALHNSTRVLGNDDDPGTRKTRHNSTYQ